MFYKKQELLNLHEHLGSPRFYWCFIILCCIVVSCFVYVCNNLNFRGTFSLKCLYLARWVSSHVQCVLVVSILLLFLFLRFCICILVFGILFFFKFYSGSPEPPQPPVFRGVRVPRTLVFCVWFVDRCLLFVGFLSFFFCLAIVLSVLRFTDSDYPFVSSNSSYMPPSCIYRKMNTI